MLGTLTFNGYPLRYANALAKPINAAGAIETSDLHDLAAALATSFPPPGKPSPSARRKCSRCAWLEFLARGVTRAEQRLRRSAAARDRRRRRGIVEPFRRSRARPRASDRRPP
jgi:hypothetical protein